MCVIFVSSLSYECRFCYQLPNTWTSRLCISQITSRFLYKQFDGASPFLTQAQKPEEKKKKTKQDRNKNKSKIVSHLTYIHCTNIVLGETISLAVVTTSQYKIHNYRNKFFYLLNSTTGNSVEMIWFSQCKQSEHFTR